MLDYDSIKWREARNTDNAAAYTQRMCIVDARESESENRQYWGDLRSRTAGQ
jgi:hypothetical protein